MIPMAWSVLPSPAPARRGRGLVLTDEHGIVARLDPPARDGTRAVDGGEGALVLRVLREPGNGRVRRTLADGRRTLARLEVDWHGEGQAVLGTSPDALRVTRPGVARDLDIRDPAGAGLLHAQAGPRRLELPDVGPRWVHLAVLVVDLLEAELRAPSAVLRWWAGNAEGPARRALRDEEG
ncbi:MAG: hypothetical protein RLZZ299_2823 [Pseudomonadota bacterium]|jgi:hypothetical protein